MAFKLAKAALIACLLIQAAAAQTSTTVLPAQPAWGQLNPSQQNVLAPLAKEWNTLPDSGKLKWLGIANRYASMTPVEQARVQERMKGWAALSPTEREKARTQYKKLRTTPADERKALEQRWQEYDALPGDEKQRLKETRPIPKPTTGASAPAANPHQTPPKALSIAPTSNKPVPVKR